MKQFKSMLTRFKGQINDKLPEGPDVYGFSGVNKSMLMRTCDDMYALAEKIETKDESQEFEIIVLKRLEAKLHGSLKKFLEEDAGSGREKDKFDDFLDKFSKLYEKTKQVYFIVNKDGLRDDVEIQNLRSQIEALTAKKAEYEEIILKVEGQALAATARAQEIENALKVTTAGIMSEAAASTTAATAVQTAHADVMIKSNEIATAHGNVVKWESNIESTSDASQAALNLANGLVNDLKLGIEQLVSAATNSEALTAETAKTHDKNQKLIKEIQDTLGDANRKGMAGAYQLQMEKMAATQEQWKKVFLGTLGGFLALSIGIIAWHLLDNTVTWQSTLSRFAMSAPLVWLAWFAVRQYGFANRVREDYAYKYATAMAYEGYAKAVREAAPDLQKALIEVAIMNMAQNPVRLYSPKDSDHASPLSEMFEKVFGRVKSVKASSSGTTVEAELKPE